MLIYSIIYLHINLLTVDSSVTTAIGIETEETSTERFLNILVDPIESLVVLVSPAVTTTLGLR